MRKLLITLLVVLMATPALFAASAESYCPLLFQNSPDAAESGDTSYASAVALGGINLYDLKAARLHITVWATTLAVDTAHFLIQGSMDNVNWREIDSLPLMTTGTATSIPYTADSTCGIPKYIRVYVKYGDIHTVAAVVRNKASAHILITDGDGDFLAVLNSGTIEQIFNRKDNN